MSGLSKFLFTTYIYNFKILKLWKHDKAGAALTERLPSNTLCASGALMLTSGIKHHIVRLVDKKIKKWIAVAPESITNTQILVYFSTVYVI